MMRISRFCVLSFAFSAVLLLRLACSAGAAATEDPLPATLPKQNTIIPLDGAKIFRSHCAACHGEKGNGDGPVAPALKSRVPQLTTLARRNHGEFPADRVRSIIAGGQAGAAHGSSEMPVWGPIFHQIENDQDLGYIRLRNVTEYLRTLQQK